MNYDTFLKLLQSIITMTDAKDPASIACAKAVLVNLNGLIRSSGMADGAVMRIVYGAERNFDHLVLHKEEFAGKPGEIRQNKAKRDRLRMTLSPHCS